MSRRGENIYKRKDGRWEARYKKYRDLFGKTHYGYLYAKSYGEVKEKLDGAKKNLELVENNIQKKTRLEIFVIYGFMKLKHRINIQPM